MNFFCKLRDLLYPRGLTCNGCGAELNDDERKYSLCKKCAGKIFDEGDVYFGERYARSLMIDGYPDVTARACFRYENVVRKYVIDYKDADKTYLCDYMALHLTELYERVGLSSDVVAYVPTSPKNRKRRGYDAMKIVAEAFAKRTGLPVCHDLFRKDGVDQNQISIDERGENVKNKFLFRDKIDGRVLLLDDVVTTGATAEECARSLLSHGAKEVSVLSFGMAGLKKDQ
ncbi:MAG: ComF family protein [Clostridia bacterium]|nr:ComF family protein [Clostridia bacterium]